MIPCNVAQSAKTNVFNNVFALLGFLNCGYIKSESAIADAGFFHRIPMKEKCSNPQGGIDISGIKISRELIQFNWRTDVENIVPGLPFFRRMAENRINITFLGMGRDKKKTFSFCCVETEYFDQVQKLMKQDPEISKNVEMINSVGTLTLFPHQSNFKLLGLVLTELGRNGLPIYAMGTSISALTFSTKYSLLNEAINKLGQVLNLPPDHAPFRPEFRVKQL